MCICDYCIDWNALTAVATLILAFVTSGLAVATVCTVTEMKKARLEDNRAYVYPLIKYDGIKGYVYLFNAGNKVAEEVTTQFNPPITPFLKGHYHGINPFDNSLTLRPHSYDRIEIFDKNEAWGNVAVSDMPTKFEITVNYYKREKEKERIKTSKTYSIDITYDKNISNPMSKPEENKGYDALWRQRK